MITNKVTILGTCMYCGAESAGVFQHKKHFQCGSTFADNVLKWIQSRDCKISQMEQRIDLLERQVAAIIERNTNEHYARPY